jgi:hypothetical protein
MGKEEMGKKDAQAVYAGCHSSRYRLMMAGRHPARFTM